MKFTFNNKTYELIVLTVAGSRLYGNSTETSDWDYRGVYIESIDSKIGTLGHSEQLETKDLSLHKALTDAGLILEETTDIVLYELNRFVSLAIDNNPNIMDTLCHDESYSIYINDKGRELIKNKTLFLSSKIKHTFSGYAISQLQRIKGHNKWINQFPNTDLVLKRIEERFKGGYIDFDWICDNFGGKVAEKITGETPQKNTKLQVTDTWQEFCTRHFNPDFELNSYRLPRLIDFCHPKDLKAKPLNINDLVPGTNVSYADFLTNSASFRTHSPSMLTVYTEGKGIFSKEGNLKANDPELVGEFVCLLAIDQNNYKASKDYINKLWEWKCNRNEKRSELEEKFGYDTKHGSHLVRLMLGAKNVLEYGYYNPTMTPEMKTLVNDVRNGKYTYEWVVEFGERLDNELNEIYKTTTIRKQPDFKKINDLVIKLQREETK